MSELPIYGPMIEWVTKIWSNDWV